MVYYDQQNIVTPPKGTPGLSPLVMGPRRGSMHTKREAPPTPPSMGPSDIATPPPITSTPTATVGSAAPPKGDDWLLFNDFCVTPTTAVEARTLYGQHKTPCLLFFQRVDLPFPPPLPASQITEHMYRRLTPEPFSLKLVRLCTLCAFCAFRAESVERGVCVLTRGFSFLSSPNFAAATAHVSAAGPAARGAVPGNVAGHRLRVRVVRACREGGA
jgi:hypothetical protein